MKNGEKPEVLEQQTVEGAVVIVVPAVVVAGMLELLGRTLGLRDSLRVTGVGQRGLGSGRFTVRIDGPGLPVKEEGAWPALVSLEGLVDGG